MLWIPSQLGTATRSTCPADGPPLLPSPSPRRPTITCSRDTTQQHSRRSSCRRDPSRPKQDGGRQSDQSTARNTPCREIKTRKRKASPFPSISRGTADAPPASAGRPKRVLSSHHLSAMFLEGRHDRERPLPLRTNHAGWYAWLPGGAFQRRGGQDAPRRTASLFSLRLPPPQAMFPFRWPPSPLTQFSNFLSGINASKKSERTAPVREHKYTRCTTVQKQGGGQRDRSRGDWPATLHARRKPRFTGKRHVFFFLA